MVSGRNARKYRSQGPRIYFSHLASSPKSETITNLAVMELGKKGEEKRERKNVIVPMMTILLNNIDNNSNHAFKKINNCYHSLAKETVGLVKVLAISSCNNYFHLYFQKIIA